MIKLILVDPQELFRAGIRHLLSQYDDLQLVADISGNKDILGAVKAHHADICILSTCITDISLVSLIKKIKRDLGRMKLLALASDMNLILARQFLMAGADGFLVKTISEGRFVDALRKLQQNKTVMPEALAQNFASRGSTDNDLSPFENLSERELDILLLMVKGKSVKQISEILHLSPKTISTYKGRIFEKMNVNSMMDVFLLAIKFGLIKSESIA